MGDCRGCPRTRALVAEVEWDNPSPAPNPLLSAPCWEVRPILGTVRGEGPSRFLSLSLASHPEPERGAAQGPLPRAGFSGPWGGRRPTQLQQEHPFQVSDDPACGRLPGRGEQQRRHIKAAMAATALSTSESTERQVQPGARNAPSPFSNEPSKEENGLGLEGTGPVGSHGAPVLSDPLPSHPEGAS